MLRTGIARSVGVHPPMFIGFKNSGAHGAAGQADG